MAASQPAARLNRVRVALVIACVAVVALLALQVATHGPVTRFDENVTLWWAAHRQAWLTDAMLAVSTAHENIMVLGVTVLIAVWLLVKRERPLLRTLIVIPVGMLLNAGLKEVFGRPRPHLEQPLVHLPTLSFPSGHAVASTVFYGAMCALVFARWPARGPRTAAVFIACLMVPLVAFSRVYLGAHYVSDVVAGIAEGIAWLALLLPRRGESGLDSRA
jgi:membrane-associated phospholipid phosphatase